MFFIKTSFFVTNQIYLCMCIYIYILLSSLATSLNTIDFSNPVCTLLFCFQIQTTKKQPTKPIFQPIMELHWLVFFFWSFCLFWFGFQSRRAKCRPHWTTLCVVPMCLKFLPNISSINYLANKNQLYHGGGPMSTQPHLWISSKCACSVDSLWFFHCLGTLTERYWKPWEKNASQPRLEYIYLIECLNFICFLCWVRAPRAPPFYTPKRAREPNQKNAKETQWVR